MTVKCSQISMSPILHRGVNLQNLFSGSILRIWLFIIDFELLRHRMVKCILITPRDHPYITLEKRWPNANVCWLGGWWGWQNAVVSKKERSEEKRYIQKKILRHIQGGYEEMLTFADKVGGIQKGQKHADVIYGWSPRKLISRLPQMSKSNSD